jgi:predicted aldo/keto reductase-like oxidoreductase
MQCRAMGKSGFKVSILGFGCMRLPTLGAHDKIDEEKAIPMVRSAIDRGVNYLDTAYPYHGGNSERVVGKIVKDGYRARVAVATKMPCWKIAAHEDFDRIFEEQRERLGIEAIDFYLLHGLSAEGWKNMKAHGAIRWLERRAAAGHIRHFGFSFHDRLPALKQIIDDYGGWTFCQLQYNYLNEHVQAGREGVEYAAAKGLAVIVMEPLLGGLLGAPPEPVKAIFDAAPGRPSPASVALRWLWDQPAVTTVLSGMGAMAQVDENIAAADTATAGCLTDAERDLVGRVLAWYKARNPVPCTTCGYCRPCPQGVAIPENFMLYNDMNSIQRQENMFRSLYAALPLEERAESCTACRECEERCPQEIKISEWMPRVHEALRRQPAKT